MEDTANSAMVVIHPSGIICCKLGPVHGNDGMCRNISQMSKVIRSLGHCLQNGMILSSQDGSVALVESDIKKRADYPLSAL